MPPDRPLRKGSRRTFLRNVAAGVGALLAAFVPGCTGEGEPPLARSNAQASNAPASNAPTCRPSEALPVQSREVRQALDYAPETPVPGERCDNCRFYQAPAESDTCGGCDHFAGPVTADGWCRVWDAPRA